MKGAHQISSKLRADYEKLAKKAPPLVLTLSKSFDSAFLGKKRTRVDMHVEEIKAEQDKYINSQQLELRLRQSIEIERWTASESERIEKFMSESSTKRRKIDETPRTSQEEFESALKDSRRYL